MATSIKELSEIKQLYAEQKKQARDIQEAIGIKLLASASAEVDKQILSDYQKSVELSNQNEALIDEITKCAEKIQKSSVAIVDTQKKIKDINIQLGNASLDLGTAIFSYYRDAYNSFFKSYYDEASTASKKCELLEKQLEAIKDEISKQSFFSKIINQLKLSTVETSLITQRKKIEAILQKAGNGIMNSDSINIICKEVDLELPVQKAIDRCNTVKRDLDNCINELNNLNDKDAKLKQTFSSIGEGNSQNAKIKSIEKQISLETKKRSGFAFTVGQQFAAKLILVDGNPTQEFSVYLNKFPELEDLSKVSKNIFINETKMNILQMEADITNTEYRIKSMQQSIVNNDQKIEELKSLNEQLAKNIADEGTNKDKLIVLKNELIGKIN